MTPAIIGVRAQAESRQLHATLAAVRAATPAWARVVIVADDPDREVRTALAGLRRVPQLAASGAAACFNALCAASDEPHVVLLESGCLPAHGWLDRLLAGVASDPRNGLAGPSTNRSWNEQAALPHASPSALAAAARAAAQRFGDAARTLEPLHSLADFCYLVRREVVQAIGAADDGYGHGPCWELDYNARAARAGFRGVWVGAAYVHRLPVTARRRADEARLFEASRQRYQDRLCGQRLRGERTTYEPHCRGDDCADFAPAALIPLRLAPPVAPPVAPVVAPAPPVAPPRATATPAAASHAHRLHPAPAPAAPPLVSCIMPTYQRRAFLPRAIAGVLAQDWPDLELIIVDDGEDRIADLLPADPRVRYLPLDGRHPIGRKRNLACRAARGELIFHFDDDDSYPPWRIRCQVAALRTADACGTSALYYRDGERAWRYDYAGPATWVAGNTLAYKRRWWAAHPFAEIQVGEDARFVRALKPQQLADLRDPALCIATIHAGNVSPKLVGQTYWHPEDPARLDPTPLVSCIMPTADRRRFVTLALQRFAEQDWPARELIIVDDGSDSVADLVVQPGVRHIRLTGRHSLGAKRNLACHEARGAIIAHWDDDDWYAPDRLRRQIAPILRGDAALTGLTMRHLLQLSSGEFWTASDDLHRRMFVGDVSGGTLVFRRSLFAGGLRYPDTNLAEDAALIRAATARGHVLERIENLGTYVYVRHNTNAWQFEPGRFVDPTGWSRTPPPPAFPAHQLAAYQAAR